MHGAVSHPDGSRNYHVSDVQVPAAAPVGSLGERLDTPVLWSRDSGAQWPAAALTAAAARVLVAMTVAVGHRLGSHLNDHSGAAGDPRSPGSRIRTSPLSTATAWHHDAERRACLRAEMHLARRTKVAVAVALALVVGGTSTAAVAATSGVDLGAKPVFLVRSDNTVDASIAGAAAARADAPLLYTDPGALDTTTRDYLASYQPTKVVLVGGTKSLSETVEASVKTLGYAPLRLAGSNRSETATMLGNLVAKLPAAKGDKGDPGPAGATGARGPAGAGAPRLLDHNGRDLGVYLGGGNVLSSTGYETYLSLYAAVDNGPGRVWFTTANCTGTPYEDMFSSIVPQPTNQVSWSRFHSAYVSITAMTPVNRTASSRLELDPSAGTYSCNTSISQSIRAVTWDVKSPATVGLPATISYPLTIQQ